MDSLQGVVLELYERYPLLKVLALKSDVATHETGKIPPFLGVLLSMIEEREVGASCVLLPSRERIGFALALLGALTTLKRSFDELELDRLTTPLSPRSLVRVAPVDCVFEVVEDGKELQGRRWILLKNPADDQIHYVPEAEAFRLTPTTDPSPRPRKGMRPGKWIPAPIDGLLGVRTGGNLIGVPNRVILVAPQGDTRDLANSTFLFGRSCGETAASEFVSWGRIAKDGRLVSEDGPHEPMIAVTHSVDYMAAACRRPEAAGKIVIVEGVRGLAANIQAYDDTVTRHRLLILSDHSELDHVDVFADRACEVWAPQPETLLIAGNGAAMNDGWFWAAGMAAQNCCSLLINPVDASDEAVERLQATISGLDTNGGRDEQAQRLLGQAWLVTATVSGWLEQPGPAGMEFFDRRVGEIEAGVQRERMWLSREVSEGLQRFLEAAARVRESEDIGRSKREELLRLLGSEEDVAVITRSAPEAARIRSLFSREGLDVPVYPVAAIPVAYRRRLVACSWPGRQSMSRVASRYPSPRIDVLTYPFEKPWLASFAGRWSREWTRHARSTEEVARITGLRYWPEPSHRRSDPPTTPAKEQEVEDPVSRILNRRRKGRDPAPVPELESREARYVGFHGSGYCFVTEGHKVPVLTDLILGGELPGDRVPLRPVRRLLLGDFVLFRDHGDQDVIATIAEHELGSSTYEELRRIADFWRLALTSIGDDPYTIWRKLRTGGLDRSAVTVKIWLTDGDRIGPRSEKDLRIIADVSGDERLSANLERVSAAIRAVWAAHIKAGFTLSELLLRELPQKLPELNEAGGRVDFTFGGGWVVCIDEIAEAPEARPYWEVNGLLFEDEA